jgi:hypothetical protein
VLLVAVALVQLALYAHAQHVVVAAVQDGARVASGEGRTPDDGYAYAEALLRAGLGSHATGVRLRIAEADGGDTVVAEASGGLRTVVPWVADARLPLSARAIVHRERFQAGRARR